MKHALWFLIVLLNGLLCAQSPQEIPSAECVPSLLYLHTRMMQEGYACECLARLCTQNAQDSTKVPLKLVEEAFGEIAVYLEQQTTLQAEEVERLVHNLEDYYSHLVPDGEPAIPQADMHTHALVTKDRKNETFCLLKAFSIKACSLTVAGNASIGGNLTVDGNENIGGNLIVMGDETVGGDLTVLGTLHPTGTITQGTLQLLGTPQQACIIFRDAALVEKARICSSAIPGDKGVFVSVDGGVTQNLRVTNSGGVTIATPSSGIALVVNGGETVASGDLTMTAGNIILPMANAAGTQGLLELGGTSTTTNVVLYEFGTRNLFAGNGAVNAAVTGTDNISIGTSANSGLTTANNTIAIGNAAIATATDSVVIGNTANTNSARAIVLGSRDSASTGIAPTAGAANAIVIGSASGTMAGPSASGLASIAIGGSDAVFPGATVSGARSICIGVNANTTQDRAIVIGSASGTAGGSAPTVDAANGIAIGSGSGALTGAHASGLAAIALGGSGGVFNGALASGDRSVAIGVNPVASGASSIALGSTAGTAGGSGPQATNTNAIAIGGAMGARLGPIASGLSSIAIGGADAPSFDGANVSGARSIGIGINANTTQDGAIVIGSASGTALGNAPTVTAVSGIAIGSASGAFAGPVASGVAGIAIGGSNGNPTVGATASGDRSVAIGVSSLATGAGAVVIGSASGGAGGLGPSATNTGSIAIGSGVGALAGATATGAAAVAIGAANGAIASASASGTRSVAIGNGATTAQADAIVLGNAAATAMKVGIAIAAPAARLHVVGPAGTPVVTLAAGAATLASAPVLINLLSGALVDTLSITASPGNQVFRVVSSRRYKENFRPIDDVAPNTYKLNPLMFDYKQENGGAKDHIGFIAEEVAEVFPSLVNYDEDGTPRSVKYECFHALAIKEIQKQQQQLDTQRTLIEHQDMIIKKLLVLIKEFEVKMVALEKVEVTV